MKFEEALEAELTVIAGLNDKVFPLNATKGTPVPYVVYVSSEGLPDKCFDGHLNSREVGCEINILASSYRNLKSLSKLVMDKLISFQGRIIGTDGPTIDNITFDDDSPELYEDQVKFYRKIINITVSYKGV